MIELPLPVVPGIDVDYFDVVLAHFNWTEAQIWTQVEVIDLDGSVLRLFSLTSRLSSLTPLSLDFVGQ